MVWLQRKPHGLMIGQEDERERPPLGSPVLPSLRQVVGDDDARLEELEDVVAESQAQENGDEADAADGGEEADEDEDDTEFARWTRRRRNRVSEAPSDDGSNDDADIDDDARITDRLQQIAEFEVQREREDAINQLDRLMQEDDDEDGSGEDNRGGGEHVNDSGNDDDRDDHFSFNGSDESDSDDDDLQQDFGLDGLDDNDEDQSEHEEDVEGVVDVAANAPVGVRGANGNGLHPGWAFAPPRQHGDDNARVHFFDQMRMRMQNGLAGVRNGGFRALGFGGIDGHGGGFGQNGPNAVAQMQRPNAGEQQEIDLTALSSDSEDNDDDDVEIVGTAVPVAAPPRGRKRRRAAPPAAPAVPPPFDTTSAESTNISMENNEVIEKFKSSLKCSVCLDVIQDMTSTICGHVYCNHCIRLAIRVTQKCPLCQRPLQPTDIHGLYF